MKTNALDVLVIFQNMAWNMCGIANLIEQDVEGNQKATLYR